MTGAPTRAAEVDTICPDRADRKPLVADLAGGSGLVPLLPESSADCATAVPGLEAGALAEPFVAVGTWVIDMRLDPPKAFESPRARPPFLPVVPPLVDGGVAPLSPPSPVAAPLTAGVLLGPRVVCLRDNRPGFFSPGCAGCCGRMAVPVPVAPPPLAAVRAGMVTPVIASLYLSDCDLPCPAPGAFERASSS